MKRYAILAMGLTWVTMGVARDANADFKKFMVKTTAESEKAYNQRSIFYFNYIITGDYSEKSAKQTIQMMDALRRMSGLLTAMKKLQAKVTLESCALTADGGTSVIRTHLVNTDTWRDGKTHTMVIDSHTRQTWTKVRNVWKLKASEEIEPTKQTLDGKPYVPPARGPRGGGAMRPSGTPGAGHP